MQIPKIDLYTGELGKMRDFYLNTLSLDRLDGRGNRGFVNEGFSFLLDHVEIVMRDVTPDKKGVSRCNFTLWRTLTEIEQIHKKLHAANITPHVLEGGHLTFQDPEQRMILLMVLK